MKIKFEKICHPKTEELKNCLEATLNIMFDLMEDFIRYAENPTRENEIHDVAYNARAKDGYISFNDFDY